MAVTNTRFIVSRDSHQPGQSPTEREIPFANILVVDLGEALTLGWFVVRFVVRERVADETIFFQSSGMDHFRAAVCAWRREAGLIVSRQCSSDVWDPVWLRTPPNLGNQVAPLLLGEEPRGVLHVAETWRRPAGRRPPVCMSAAGFCAITDSMVLLAQSEQPHRPGVLVFAVQVTCLDRRCVRDVAIIAAHPQASPESCLAFDIRVGAVEQRFTMPVGHVVAGDLESALAELWRTGVRC